MPVADVKAVLATIPALPGVYRFQDDKGRALYIGKAANLKKRVSSYFRRTRQSPRIALMLRASVSVDTIVTASEPEALLLENNLIKSLRPRYNILFRDDKSYPYLRLSRHPYPRLMFYRGKTGDGADYFGPFPDSGAVRETTDLLQRLFRLRTCTDAVFSSRQRPCLLHPIGRCSAPCVNKVSPRQYAADVGQAKNFLHGGVSSIVDRLQEEMREAAESERFEEAARLRDRLRALAVVRSEHFADDEEGADADYVGVWRDDARACVNVTLVRGGRRIGEKRLFPDNSDGVDNEDAVNAFLSQYYRSEHPPRLFVDPLPADWREAAPHLREAIVSAPDARARLRLRAAVDNARQALETEAAVTGRRAEELAGLAKTLSLPVPPVWMECFDVSHSMGEETMASRVVFVNGVACRSRYRLYRIRGAANDDPAAIREAVGRCYRRQEDGSLPDAVFVDGGTAQLTAAVTAFADLGVSPPPLFAIAKGAGRRPGEETIISAEGETWQLPPTSAVLHLVQRLRDEAHRFALSGHRRRRDKKRGRTLILDGVEGIGDKKRRLLLTYFGGLAALRSASVGELVKIPGIGPRLAARIYQGLHR